MIKPIHSNDEAREFLNSIPFDEYVPEDVQIILPLTLILGWYDQELLACFPCNIREHEIEVHVACKKEIRGKKAVHACREAIKYIFENTRFDRIVGEPKSREASINAYLCGMRRNGDMFEVSRWADLSGN